MNKESHVLLLILLDTLFIPFGRHSFLHDESTIILFEIVILYNCYERYLETGAVTLSYVDYGWVK